MRERMKLTPVKKVKFAIVVVVVVFTGVRGFEILVWLFREEERKF